MPRTEPLNSRETLMRLASEEIERARRYGADLALLVWEIDHANRPQALQWAVQAARESSRATDVIGRLAAGTFAVLFPHTRAAEARYVGHRLARRLAEEPVVLGEEAITVSSYYGVSEWGVLETDSEQLFDRARAACRKARERGPGEVVVHLPQIVPEQHLSGAQATPPAASPGPYVSVTEH